MIFAGLASYACLTVAVAALGTAWTLHLQRKAVERSGYVRRIRRFTRA